MASSQINRWKFDTNEQGRRKGQLVPQVIGFQKDSPGQAAWRRKDKPQDRIKVNLGDRVPNEGLQSKRSVLPVIRDIEAQTHTEIAVASPRSSRPGEFELSIFGNEADVQNARQKLQQWEQTANPQGRSKPKAQIWAKVSSKTTEEWNHIYQRLQDEERRREFLRVPDNTTQFPAQGSFTWPEDIDGVRKILGSGFEALDPIRKEERSFIVLKTADNEGAEFVVSGNHPDRVRKATTRVRGVFFHTVSGRRDTVYKHIFAQQPAETKRPVFLLPNNEIGSRSPSLRNPTARSHGSQAHQSTPWMFHHLEAVRKITNGVLTYTRYYRSRLHMCAVLGQFRIKTTESKDRMKLSEVIDHSSADPATSKVSDHLSLSPSLPSIFKRFTTEQRLFARSVSEQSGLPEFSCVLQIRDKDQRRLTLEVCSNLHKLTDQDDPAEERRAVWSRWYSENEPKHQMMHCNLIDLTRLNAWGLQMTASYVLDEKNNEVLDAFAANVKLQPSSSLLANPSSSDEPFYAISPHNALQLISMEQRRTWRFYLADSKFHCELTKSQVFEPKVADRRFVTRIEVAPDKAKPPQWSVALCNGDWDHKLSKNIDLPLGEGVSEWKPEWHTFFPPKAITDRAMQLPSSWESMTKAMAKIQDLVERP